MPATTVTLFSVSALFAVANLSALVAEVVVPGVTGITGGLPAFGMFVTTFFFAVGGVIKVWYEARSAADRKELVETRKTVERLNAAVELLKGDYATLKKEHAVAFSAQEAWYKSSLREVNEGNEDNLNKLRETYEFLLGRAPRHHPED